MYRYLLLVRFGLFNLVAVSLVIGAFLQGWVDVILGAKLVEFSASSRCGIERSKSASKSSLSDSHSGMPPADAQASTVLSAAVSYGPMRADFCSWR